MGFKPRAGRPPQTKNPYLWRLNCNPNDTTDMTTCTEIFERARAASRKLALLDAATIDRTLRAVADRIGPCSETILASNALDLERMDPSDPRYDRLKLTPERLQGIADDMRNVASLPSPVGLTLDQTTRPNGMTITKVSVPFGVIGIIYEARPNVGFDCFSLCFKSGNAVILKGGSDALHSNEAIVEQYLGRDYRIGGGLKYTILEDNVGYINYNNFSSGIGNGNIDEMLSYLSVCNGLIIDVRNNGGGVLTYSSRLASRFTNERVLTGYIQHKTGPGHSDFSDPEPIYLEPSNSIRWQKPVVVLTNRQAYSATNDFVNSMSCLPLVTLMGDKTGGGGGLPFSSELPNGWSVRFSASPHLNAEKEHIEGGIEPDIWVDMDASEEAEGIDTIIETARALIHAARNP